MVALVQEEGAPNDDVARAAEILKNWNGQMRTDAPGYPLAAGVLEVIQESVGADWIMGYGGNWAGMTAIFRAFMEEYAETGRAPKDPKHRAWLLQTLLAGYATESAQDPSWKPNGYRYTLHYQDIGSGSLDPEHDLQSPPLLAPLSHTLWSQTGESYCQVVDLADPDRSLAMMPPGISENPESPHFADQMTYWESGQMRPAPVNREAVESVKASSKVIMYQPAR